MIPRQIKVLFLIDYFHRTGGTEKHLAQLVCWLASHGFHCEVVVFDLGKNELIEDMRRAGAIVHDIRVEREYGVKGIVGAVRLARLIRRQRFDVVQTFHQKSDTYGAFIARLAGVRHIISSKRDMGQGRKAHHFFLNRRLRFLFERAIVVADAVANAFVASDRLDPTRLVKIYNGVDSDKFAPPSRPEQALESRARFGLRAQDFVVGMVAGFRPEKDHGLLFESALAVRARIPNLRLLLVGDGPLLAQLRTQYSAHDIATFAGDVHDVWNALKAMDVGCLLSSNEGFSNAVVEQMSAGLPMIASDVGGNREAVCQGENGYLVSSGDKQACINALIELSSDPEERQKMGRRSRQLVLEKFSLAQMCERHARLYGELCGTAIVADGSLSSTSD